MTLRKNIELKIFQKYFFIFIIFSLSTKSIADETEAKAIISEGKVVASGTNKDGNLRMTVLHNDEIYFCLHNRLPSMSLGSADIVSIECHKTNYDNGEQINKNWQPTRLC